MLYLDIGDGENILVMLHGLGERFDESWKPQYELSKHYRLIIPSLRGHLGNELKGNLTLEYMALDVIELLQKLKIDSCYIMGLSLGGLVAQELYRQKPEMVRGLILSNTTYYIPSYFANKIVEKSEKLFHEDKDKLISYIATKAIHNQEYLEETKRRFYLSDSYLECALSGAGYNYFSVLLRVKVPTLLIGSRFDTITPLYNLFLIKWMIPKAETVIFNSGHLSNIECSEEFNQAIREFIGVEVNE